MTMMLRAYKTEIKPTSEQANIYRRGRFSLSLLSIRRKSESLY